MSHRLKDVMSEPDIEKQVSDGLIVSAAIVSGTTVSIHTASKKDVESLYSAVSPVAIESSRHIEKTNAKGIHREYYLELANSDTHSVENEYDFEWNTRPIWQLTFEPTQYFQQRMFNWFDVDKIQKAPTDFKITPLIAKICYFSGAHELAGKDGEPYIEINMANFQKLEAELQNIDVQTINVRNLWRLDVKNSKKFREYAEVPTPTAQVNTGG